MDSPTDQTYGTLQNAYIHFNKVLFNRQLPSCLITVQRHQGAYGYFCGDRFGKVGNAGEITDEIAMNPAHFGRRSTNETLSTLVHEMVHLWQHHFGKPPRRCYHNREWAAKMKEVGLIPSDTGSVGGSETGQRMTHYIEQGGPFDRACEQWLARNSGTLYHDRESTNTSEAGKTRLKKIASKTRFTCPDCGANAWGKPDLHLLCGDCRQMMVTAI